MSVSFVGFMPAEDPAFVCLVMLDEPKVPQEKNYGGMVAAPVFAQIARKGRALSRPQAVAGIEAAGNVAAGAEVPPIRD